MDGGVGVTVTPRRSSSHDTRPLPASWIDVEVDGMSDDSGAPPEALGGGEEVADAAPDRLAAVEAALTALAQRLDAESARAAARERVIDRQHADIERLRAAERGGVLRPVVTDLCRLRNDLLRQAATLPQDLSAEGVAALLESFAQSVEEALLRCGVEVQPRTAGIAFDPRRQQVARVVEDADPARDGTVAEVVQDGYTETDGGRVVLPARVAVHRVLTGETKETVDA
jgi:molecular chaperone GrpE (heat shock protein)